LATHALCIASFWATGKGAFVFRRQWKALSTGGAGRVPRGRPKAGGFRDHENLRFSNDLTPRVKAVSSGGCSTFTADGWHSR